MSITIFTLQYPPPPFFLVYVRHHLHPLPGPCQVSTCLLSPPHLHPRPRCYLRLPTQVQNRSRSYEMRNRVLPSPNVFPHRLEIRLLSCCRCRSVRQFSVIPYPWDSPCQPSQHLVLEPPHDPDHAEGDHPGFCAEKQHQPDHGFKEKPGYTRHCPLPSENPSQLLPHHLQLGQVSHYHQPVIVCC